MLLSSLKTELANQAQQIASLHQLLITTVLDNAIIGGRIFPAERPQWQSALQRDFSSASAELANAAPRLNMSSRAETLPRIPPVPAAGDNKRDRILGLVNERMRQSGLSFYEAWVSTKSEHPGLFG